MKAQKPELVTAPAADLLTLAEVKEYLRLETEDTDEDVGLALLIKGAVAALDGHSGMLGRALMTQTWAQKFDDFPEYDRIRVAFGPVQQVNQLAYIDELGATQTFDAWHLVNEPIGPAIVLQDGATWPSTDTRPDAVTVTWLAGFGEASAVPEQFRIAALQLVGHWYTHREPVSVGGAAFEVPWHLKQTIASMRAFGG